jgi:hypothetical protein
MNALQKDMTKHSFIAESEKSKPVKVIYRNQQSAINLLFVKLITIRISQDKKMEGTKLPEGRLCFLKDL